MCFHVMLIYVLLYSNQLIQKYDLFAELRFHLDKNPNNANLVNFKQIYLDSHQIRLWITICGEKHTQFASQLTD